MTAKNTSLENGVITKNVPTIQNNLPKGKDLKPAEKVDEIAFNALVEKFAPEKKPTAEERILNSEHFEAHKTRFKYLKEKSNDLKMFKAGNDKTDAKISLKNSSGFSFEVRNSNVIDKVLATMEAELNILLNESENEVLNFVI